MRALLSQNLEEVREVLKEDPEAAMLPFFDHAIESPLCCAARLGLGPEFFSVLVEHQADVNATNVQGRSALAVVCSLAPKDDPSSALQQLLDMSGSPFARSAEVEAALSSNEDAGLLRSAARLLAAGADMHLPDNQGVTAQSLALASRSKALASLMKYYHGVQASAVLLRAGAWRQDSEPMATNPLGTLSDGPLTNICSFLVPAPLVERLAPLTDTHK